MAKTGRNERCPCGSGLKYKKCCGGRAAGSRVEITLEAIRGALQALFGYLGECQEDMFVAEKLFFAAEDERDHAQRSVDERARIRRGFLAWAGLDMDLAQDRTLTHELLESIHSLDRHQVEVLEALQSTHVGLYRIEQLEPEVVLEDLWDRGPVRVDAWQPGQPGSVGDLVAVRLLRTAGKTLQVDESAWVFRGHEQLLLMQRLESRCVDTIDAYKTSPARFLKRCGLLFHRWWWELQFEQEKPAPNYPQQTVDLEAYFVSTGNFVLPAPLRREAEYYANIALDCHGVAGPRCATSVSCRRRPHGKACSGRIEAKKIVARKRPEIYWKCTHCTDSGWIGGYQEVLARCPEATPEDLSIELEPAEYRELLKLPALTSALMLVVLSARVNDRGRRVLRARPELMERLLGCAARSVLSARKARPRVVSLIGLLRNRLGHAEPSEISAAFLVAEALLYERFDRVLPDHAPPSEGFLQVTIRLEDVPGIVRVVEVPARLTLHELHEVIQISMGWQDSHLYEFEVEGRIYSTCHRGSKPDDIDAETVRLSSLGLLGRAPIRYTYDFGDCWRHTLEFAAARREASVDGSDRRLRLVSGEGACPPEDCGGPPGFAVFRQACRDPDHPRHDELRRWVTQPYDPDRFPADLIARQLARYPWPAIVGARGANG